MKKTRMTITTAIVAFCFILVILLLFYWMWKTRGDVVMEDANCGLWVEVGFCERCAVRGLTLGWWVVEC